MLFQIVKLIQITKKSKLKQYHIKLEVLLNIVKIMITIFMKFTVLIIQLVIAILLWILKKIFLTQYFLILFMRIDILIVTLIMMSLIQQLI